MILTDLEIAAKLKSTHFQGNDSVVKRRVRKFLTEVAKIKPVEKREEVWLYRESDIFRINEWQYVQSKGKVRPSTKRPGRSRGTDAFEKAQALLS